MSRLSRRDGVSASAANLNAHGALIRAEIVEVNTNQRRVSRIGGLV
ncbi:hypothetical protein SEA_MASK_43 [Mycobacterium phage Mask]|nr:hypothetical protein SEA_MASK_43 [Mycobacterium phage Mask]